VNWIAFAFIGGIAQLIDGALGMGFGLTSSSLLITLGASAALASAAVHAAEICTTLSSGISHWHAKNVDKEILLRLAIPGGIGAFLGATFLSFIDLSSSKIFISTLLLFMGFLLLYRNIFKADSQVNVIEIKSIPEIQSSCPSSTPILNPTNLPTKLSSFIKVIFSYFALVRFNNCHSTVFISTSRTSPSSTFCS
jgi:uncharacterized membrane protein YfcA